MKKEIKSQVELFVRYEKQERQKKGIVNHHDHWEEVSSTLMKWLGNKKLKESGKIAFTKIWLSVFKLYQELVDKEIEKESYNYYNDLSIRLEGEKKQLKSLLVSKNIEILKLNQEIALLKKQNEENDRHLRRVWQIES